MTELTRLEADLEIVNARLGAARQMTALLIVDLRELLAEAIRIDAALTKIKLP